MTVYLYLNDVEAGGGTKFNGLNITVMPKRGRALFWPSVLNDSPNEKDSRTNHEGASCNRFHPHNIFLCCLTSFPFPLNSTTRRGRSEVWSKCLVSPI